MNCRQNYITIQKECTIPMLCWEPKSELEDITLNTFHSKIVSKIFLYVDTLIHVTMKWEKFEMLRQRTVGAPTKIYPPTTWAKAKSNHTTTTII